MRALRWLAVLLIVGAASAAALAWWWLAQPLPLATPSVEVSVEPGTSPRTILSSNWRGVVPVSIA